RGLRRARSNRRHVGKYTGAACCYRVGVLVRIGVGCGCCVAACGVAVRPGGGTVVPGGAVAGSLSVGSGDGWADPPGVAAARVAVPDGRGVPASGVRTTAVG